MPTEPIKGPASYFPSIEKKYGRPVSAWQQIVRDNGLEDVITVVRGRVEDIQLPEGVESVDVIVSEWMGYGLLYESMLDSVLHARDRFLKKEGGVMAPSQCKMQLCLCEGGEIFKERIGFWSDVYGREVLKYPRS